MIPRRLMISLAGGHEFGRSIILHTEEELPPELVEQLKAEIDAEVIITVGPLPDKTPMMEELKYLPLELKQFEESKHGPRAVEPVALGKLFRAPSNRGGDHAVRPSGTSRFVRPPKLLHKGKR